MGTSMATPVTSANVALAREFLFSGSYRSTPFVPSGALLKAIMIHSGQPTTIYEDQNGNLYSFSYPDNHQGYGRVQLDQYLDLTGIKYTLVAVGSANTSDPRYYRQVVHTGDVHKYEVTMVNATATNPTIAALKTTWGG